MYRKASLQIHDSNLFRFFFKCESRHYWVILPGGLLATQPPPPHTHTHTLLRSRWVDYSKATPFLLFGLRARCTRKAQNQNKIMEFTLFSFFNIPSDVYSREDKIKKKMKYMVWYTHGKLNSTGEQLSTFHLDKMGLQKFLDFWRIFFKKICSRKYYCISIVGSFFLLWVALLFFPPTLGYPSFLYR